MILPVQDWISVAWLKDNGFAHQDIARAVRFPWFLARVLLINSLLSSILGASIPGRTKTSYKLS